MKKQFLLIAIVSFLGLSTSCLKKEVTADKPSVFSMNMWSKRMLLATAD